MNVLREGGAGHPQTGLGVCLQLYYYYLLPLGDKFSAFAVGVLVDGVACAIPSAATVHFTATCGWHSFARSHEGGP